MNERRPASQAWQCSKVLAGVGLPSTAPHHPACGAGPRPLPHRAHAQVMPHEAARSRLLRWGNRCAHDCFWPTGQQPTSLAQVVHSSSALENYTSP
jgi:hypothetical protein